MFDPLMAGELVSVGALAALPVPCETRTSSVAAVFPASIAVVLAALWYGIEPREPPSSDVAVVALPFRLPLMVVAVRVVKTPVEGTDAPMVVLLIVLFVIVAPLIVPFRK